MDIQKDILSKINLTDSQKRQIASLGSNAGAISKFLEEQNIKVPAEIRGALGNIAGTTKAAGKGVANGAHGAAKQVKGASQGATDAMGDMLKGVLDSTDLDEKILGNIPGFGKK